MYASEVAVIILLAVFLGSAGLTSCLIADSVGGFVDRITFDSCPGPMLGIRLSAGKCSTCEVFHFDIFIYIGWSVIIIALGQRPVEAI